ncbi:AraC family transcriptional regulator [Chitiniphilus shinanonensis]|uniref:AraC family transcriptional regulator n=1 Tax=Chitiniphilus shinanonensis TaxID=553088 RepID=A0ABQ6BPZ1_9NEIS|nr:AraC family transcriptional regulator [Chitiniphilus shinanonensis]GLS04105.1 AraC family transcriptional regulator [Chitiniphilus shinanonensis]
MLTRELVGRTFGQDWHYIALDAERVPFLWHYHPEFELTLTLGAEGLRYLGGDVAPFGEADLALVGPGQAHTWHATPRSDGGLQRVQVVYFTEEWLRGLSSHGLPELAGFRAWLDSARDGVVFSPACVAQVLPLFQRLHTSRGMLRLACLFEIFDALARDGAARRLGGGHGEVREDPRLRAALDHLHAHYREPVAIDDVARVAATSPATLKRLFREGLFSSVTEVLQQLRLGHACHLLVSSDLPIQLVAEHSGFANPGHFYRLFARQRGCTPAEFRRRHHLRAAQIASEPFDAPAPSLDLQPCGGPAR